MIIDVAKFLIMGTQNDLDRFFNEAQHQGFIEFISISSKKPATLPESIQTLISSIKILKKLPLKDCYEGKKDPVLAMKVAQQTIELKNALEKLHEEKRILDEEISRVTPFGAFSMEDLNFIEKHGHRTIQFFCMKTNKRREFQLPPSAFYINTEYDLDYFITINPEPLSIPGMIEMRIDASVGELRQRLSFVQDSIQRHENELKNHAEYLTFLQKNLADKMSDYDLFAAKQEVTYPLKNNLFFVEAWIPKNKIHKLDTLIGNMQIYIEQIAIEKSDRIPTHIENKGLGLVGEELVRFYDIPSITDKDPSRWVMIFFAIFFAIIIGDAGYGFIFLAGAFFIKFKFPYLKDLEKRLLNMAFILSYSTIIWGVLTSAYFGLHLSPSHPLQKISPMHYLVEKKADYHLKHQDDVFQSLAKKYPQIAQSKNGEEMIQQAVVHTKRFAAYPIVEDFTNSILLDFTLILGIIHISIAFIRYARRHIAGWGWVLFMIGGYLYFPSLLQATSILEFTGIVPPKIATPLGFQLICIGGGFAFIAALIQHRLKGLSEIAHSVQVFADVLSYLRLYALNLAGAIIASTFNHEGANLGLFIGFIVLLLGHSLNIGLALMGGVIHGLRLNFLEWYHYCFEGGGRLFKPLQKIKHR